MNSVTGQIQGRGVASITMSGLVKVTVKSDRLMPHIENASKVIKDYTAIFIFEDGQIGSGTFVTACGFDGVLTAWHVAEHLSRFQEFALCVADYPHGFWISSEIAEHVPVGVIPKNSAPEDGPDLSFLIIRDADLLKKLRMEKSFYPLDSSRSPSFHPLLNQRIWGIAGTFCESLKRIEENYHGGPLSRLFNVVGAGFFPFETLQRGDFDYLKLKVPSGEHHFPDNYNGMSGGGFWIMPMQIDPSGNIRHRSPVLAGVEFAQSGWGNRERILTGHGPRSIYARLRQALSERSILSIVV